MVFGRGTTCLNCQIAINIASFESCHCQKSDFLEDLLQETLDYVGQASLQLEIWIFHCVFGFGGDPYYVC